MSADVIESVKAQVAERADILKAHPAMEQMLKLHSALNQLEDVYGVPRTGLAQFFGFVEGGNVENVTPMAQVQPGQYLGWNPLNAAKDFLAKRGRAATLDEIILALKTGSCDPESKFALSLSRSTFNFVKLGEDLYDLLDRYPEEKQKRSISGKRKPAAPARVEEIMREQAPISLAKAVAQAESEDNKDNS